MSLEMQGAVRGEEQKRIVAAALAAISRGDIAAFTALLAPNYVRHCQAMPAGLQELHGPEAMHGWLQANQATFPDYTEEVEALVAEGDFVAWRSRGRGTMAGPMGPFPATGRTMEITIMGMHRFENGLIAETWTSWDNVAALVQLGLLPAGAPG